MRTMRVVTGFGALTLTLLPATLSSAQSITGIGVAPGATRSFATGVSADGTVISAWCAGGAGSVSQAYRWTVGGGFEFAGPAGTDSHAATISGDGTTLIGATNFPRKSFRWTQGSAEFLPVENDPVWTQANAVSHDGSTIVGETSFDWNQHDTACRWTAASGLQSLGTLPGMSNSYARGVSADGAVITGRSDLSRSDQFARAFRWSESDGMLDLGVLPGHVGSTGIGVSADGQTLVGSSWGPDGAERPIRWTEVSGMQSLGLPSGFDAAAALAASADGSVIVGTASVWSEAPVWSATIWTEALGTRNLHEYLTSLGVDLSGWHLEDARAVSADGTVIVGTGYYNGVDQGWVVTIPAPAGILLLLPCSVWAAARRARRHR